MRTTFINQNSEGTIVKDGERHLISRSGDLSYYMNISDEPSREALRDVINRGNYSFSEIRELINQTDDLGPFNEYGLCFDYVELGTFNDQEEDYFRYQFSWGGPSEELRFYEDGTIVFVYLDWFSGVGFDVTGEDWAESTREWFNGCDMLNFENEREKYDYIERVYAMENGEEDTEEENE
jgi:hypothetical protein